MKKNEWINPELANLNLAATKEADNIVTEEHCDAIEAINNSTKPGLICRGCGAPIWTKHATWCRYYVSTGKPGDMPGLDAAPSAS